MAKSAIEIQIELNLFGNGWLNKCTSPENYDLCFVSLQKLTED